MLLYLFFPGFLFRRGGIDHRHIRDVHLQIGVYDVHNRIILQRDGDFDTAVLSAAFRRIIVSNRAGSSIACCTEIIRILCKRRFGNNIGKHCVGAVSGENAVCLGAAGGIGVTGNDDAVDIPGVFRAGQELGKHTDQLV